MAERLTRSYLRALKIEDEDTVTAILEAHTETTSALLKYKADAEKLPGVQAELDQAKKDLADRNKDGWKEKHDAVKKELDDYKAAQTAKDTKAAKETAYRALLKEAGVNEKRIDAVLRVTDLDKIELENGAVKGAEEVKNAIKTEWAEFITTAGQSGAGMTNPPAGGGTHETNLGELSMADYIKARSGK